MNSRASAQSSNRNQELLYCYHCKFEWTTARQELECPRCGSDCVEIIDPGQDDDPRSFDRPFSNPLGASSPMMRDAPDPDEDDISRISFAHPSGPSPAPFGAFYSTRSTNVYPLGGFHSTHRSPSYNNQYQNQVFTPFASMLQTMIPRRGFQQNFGPGMGPGVPFRPQSAPPNRDPHRNVSQGATSRPRVEIYTGPGFSFTTSTTTTSRGFGGAHDLDSPGSINIHDFFHQMLAGGMGHEEGQARAAGSAGGIDEQSGQVPLNPLQALLNSVMQWSSGTHGDAVFTQEAFDRVMSQLMEEHTSGSAPGPASEAAIAALPRKAVSKDMLDENTGKADCSICMDEVELGEEVTELPCHHWFHQLCVEAWLKEHDTCPVCRAGITPKDGPAETVRTPEQEPLHDQDPFLLARQESLSRDAQFLSPASRPIRERERRPYQHQVSGQPGSPSSPQSDPRSSSLPQRRRASSVSTRSTLNRASNRGSNRDRRSRDENMNTGVGSSSGSAMGSLFERARSLFGGGSSSSGNGNGSGNGAFIRR